MSLAYNFAGHMWQGTIQTIFVPKYGRCSDIIVDCQSYILVLSAHMQSCKLYSDAKYGV